MTESRPPNAAQRPERRSHATDTGAMVALQSGDSTALGALYDRHSAYLVAIASRMLGARAEAEDVVQSVFVEAWQRCGQYRPDRASVRTWLAMRVRSRCLDRLRSVTWNRKDGLDAAPERPAALTTTGLHRRIDAERASAAVDALTDDQQSVLRLGYFKGLSSREIADHLDIPTGTVKSRVRAAMQRLRETMEVSS